MRGARGGAVADGCGRYEDLAKLGTCALYVKPARRQTSRDGILAGAPNDQRIGVRLDCADRGAAPGVRVVRAFDGFIEVDRPIIGARVVAEPGSVGRRAPTLDQIRACRQS